MYLPKSFERCVHILISTMACLKLLTIGARCSERSEEHNAPKDLPKARTRAQRRQSASSHAVRLRALQLGGRHRAHQIDWTWGRSPQCWHQTLRRLEDDGAGQYQLPRCCTTRTRSRSYEQRDQRRATCCLTSSIVFHSQPPRNRNRYTVISLRSYLRPH